MPQSKTFNKVDIDEYNRVFRPDPSEGLDGIQSHVEAGNAVVLEPNSTYTMDQVPLNIDVDNFALVGYPGSTLKVGDNVMADNNAGPQISISGSHNVLEGFTFDGNEANQGATDTFGIEFDPDVDTFHNQIRDMQIYNAVGDGIGEVGPGTIIENCIIDGVTEDVIDFVPNWEGSDKPIRVDRVWGRGPNGIKTFSEDKSRGFITVENSTFIGENTAAGDLHGDIGLTEISFDNTLFISNDNSVPTFYINSEGSTYENVEFTNCEFRGEGVGFEFRSTTNTTSTLLSNCYFDTGDGAGNYEAIAVNASGVDVDIVRPQFSGYTADEITTVDGARLKIDTDDAIQIGGTVTPSDIVYNGTLGAFPNGGVDLSTATGWHDGQKATSDGTATDFPEFSEARWDSANAQWVRADGQATI